MVEQSYILGMKQQMTAQRISLSLSQRQSLKLHNELEAWEHDPYGQLPETQVGKSISLSNGSNGFNIGEFWKRDVRTQLLDLPLGEPVTIAVTGTGSGAGKGSINEGLLYLATHDLYMHRESVNRGFFIVPLVIPFAMYMKAAQIPKEKGGPGIINPTAGHGRFTEREYAQGSSFGQWLYDIHSAKRRDNVRFLYLLEGSGTPWIKKKGPRIKVTGMPDRGASVVYNKPKRGDGKKYILIVDRDRFVGEQSSDIRNRFNPTANDFSGVFNIGRERYLLTNRMGVVKNVGSMPPSVKRAVVELLKISTAPPQAIARSDSEFMKLKEKLADKKVIPNTGNEAYLRSLRERLVYKTGGYADDEVLIVDNPWRSMGTENDHYLDYLLRYNWLAQLFKRQLIPGKLRGTYMDLPPDYIYLGGRRDQLLNL